LIYPHSTICAAWYEKRAQKALIFAQNWSTFVNFCQFLRIFAHFLRLFKKKLRILFEELPPNHRRQNPAEAR